MIDLIVTVGKSKFPVRVFFEYQPYQEEVMHDDGLVNPEIPPHIEIKSISFGGYDLDEILNPLAVKEAKKKCHDEMIRRTELGLAHDLTYPELTED